LAVIKRTCGCMATEDSLRLFGGWTPPPPKLSSEGSDVRGPLEDILEYGLRLKLKSLSVHS
jgi:hypothetical protein